MAQNINFNKYTIYDRERSGFQTVDSAIVDLMLILFLFYKLSYQLTYIFTVFYIQEFIHQPINNWGQGILRSAS